MNPSKYLFRNAIVVLAVLAAPTVFPLTARSAEPGETNTPAAELEITNPAPLATGEAPSLTNSVAENSQQARVFKASKTGDLVTFGHSVEVKPGEAVNSVVVFGGSALIRGKVRQDLVVFGGSANVQGQVNGDTVVFGGNIHLNTNATVQGDAVVFLGGTRLETNAAVNGDAVSFGGGVDVADGATVHGDVVPFAFPGATGELPPWLEKWFKQCVLKLRPLAPSVGWVWMFAGAWFLVYLLVVTAFAKPVAVCVQAVERRPVTTFLLGILTKMLVPILSLFLAVTGIGLLVLPFLGIALLLASVVGKAALLEYLGMAFGKQFGTSALQKPILAFALGWVMVTLLYIIPVLGLIAFLVFGLWGMGCVVAATFGAIRRESPPKAPVQPMPFVPGGGGAGQGSPAGAAAFAQSASGTVTPVTEQASVPMSGADPQPNVSMPTGATPNVPEVIAHPRAGFWERLAAAFLDIVLVSILVGLASSPMPHHGHGPPFGLLVALAYFAGMWAWKGTTVGGIVLSLKVTRFDGQPLSFSVALVRALAAAFSIIVFFLGFLWIAWDRENQGWHDKIAGTVVVRLPRGNPLICI